MQPDQSSRAVHICRCDQSEPAQRRRGPFLGLVGAGSQLADTNVKKQEQIFKKLQELYVPPITFDGLVGFIGDLSGWHVFKTRPPVKITQQNRKAKYCYVELSDDELHHGFQFLLSGILSVYYDETRRNVRRPGYTAFPPKPASNLGHIPFEALR